MRMLQRILGSVLVASLVVGFVVQTALLGAAGKPVIENWPGFRGPRGDGSSLELDLPVRWSAGENVAWKTPIPGKGHSSPIIWNDRVFVVTCLEATAERALLCLERTTGKVLWQRTVLNAPLERVHAQNSRASSTPLTDGERVYVSFLDVDPQDPEKKLGKMFVAAYDFSGKQLWEARPGPFSSVHGYCASPILYQDKLIVNGDHDGESFLVALNRKTGATEWKVEREHRTRSYCTPLIRELDGQPHMMLAGNKCVASYNPSNGQRQWIIDGPTEQFVAAPVFNGKLLFITAGYPELHMLAINPRGKGNITDTNIVWRTRRSPSYVPSPVAFGPYFIVVSDTGMASCLQADDGQRLWHERLPGNRYSASPVATSEHVYFLNDRGTVSVVEPGAALSVVATNELGEPTDASPAFSHGQLFIRGEKHLFAIGKAK